MTTTPSPAAGSENIHKRLVEISYSYSGYVGIRDNNMWVKMFLAIEAAFAAQNDATYAAVMEALEDLPIPIGPRSADKTYATVSNYVRAELRQAIVKIFRKEQA